jgi:hypothetical protein
MICFRRIACQDMDSLVHRNYILLINPSLYILTNDSSTLCTSICFLKHQTAGGRNHQSRKAAVVEAAGKKLESRFYLFREYTQQFTATTKKPFTQGETHHLSLSQTKGICLLVCRALKALA